LNALNGDTEDGDQAWELSRARGEQPLQRRVARGLTWTIVDIWGRQALNLIVFVILANLLLPVDFGLVALAAVFVGFAQLFVDQGLGDALVQRRVLTRSHIDTAFWAALVTGGLLTLVGLAAAGPIATVLRAPDLAPLLAVLSLSFILAAFSTIQMDLLRRELAFKSLAMRSIAAATVGGIVGIGAAAVFHLGAWALVAQQLASAVASIVTLWWVVPWRPSRRFSGEHFRELFGFGIHVVGSDLVAFLGRNSDKLFVGLFIGTVQLGFYAVAYRLQDTTQALLINIARKIAFPALASLQHDRDRLERAYFRGSRVSAALIMPAYLGLALVAPELMVVVFGRQWAEAGPVGAVLFLIGPAFTLQSFSHVLFMAVGRPDVGFRFRFLAMVANVIGFLVAVPFGIVAVAAAWVVSSYLLLPLNLHWQQRYGGMSIRGYVVQLRGLAAATALMVAGVAATRFGLAGSLGQAGLLAAQVIAGVVVYLVALRLLDRPLLADAFGFALAALPGGARIARRPSPTEAEMRAAETADDGSSAVG
jgi:O-antigen/teichoic acid export membrane protein